MKVIPLRVSHVAACCIVAVLAGGPAQAADAQPSPFDGKWEIVLVCPPFDAEDDDALGYTQRFPAEIRNGEVRGVHGKEGEPGWHLVTGSIGADGNAMLKLEGVVSNAKYAINDAPRGKAYSYRIRARFEPSVGTGVRVGKRKCDFQFTRK